MRLLLLITTCVLFAPTVEAKDHAHPMKEIEERAKKELTKGKDAAKRFDGFMTWLGVAATCPVADCKEITSAKWLAANLDSDAEDEKVLAITTIGGAGSGACPSAHLEVLVFDSVAKGFAVVAHRSVRLTAALKPIAEVTATHVHSNASKDLVIRVDGECDGTREHEVRVEALENGKLVELAASSDHVGKDLLAHKIVGSPPATIELASAKRKVQLLFDEAAEAYDPLPSYGVAIKSQIAKEDDTTLSIKECSAPLGTSTVVGCGLVGSAKVQVVVQNGKATGLTVSVIPPAPAFVRCVRKDLVAASWKSASGATGCIKTFTAK